MAMQYLGTGLLRVADVGLATGIAAQHLAAPVNALCTSGYSVHGKGAATYVSDALATAGLAAAHPRICKQSLDGRYWRLDGEIDITKLGAIGDGTADDTAAIQAAINLGRAVFAPAGTYKITSTINFPFENTEFRGEGRDHTIFRCDGITGSVFKCTAALYFRPFWSDFSIIDETLSTTGIGIDITGLNWAGGGVMYNYEIKNIDIRVKGNALACYSCFSGSFQNVQTNSSTGHGFVVSCGPAVGWYNCYAQNVGTGKAGYRLCGLISLYSCNGIDSGDYWGIFGQDPTATGTAAAFKADFPNFTYNYPSLYMVGCNIEHFEKCGILTHSAVQRVQLVSCKVDRSGKSSNYIALFWARVQNVNFATPIELAMEPIYPGSGIPQGTSGALTNAWVYASDAATFRDTSGNLQASFGGYYSDTYGGLVPFTTNGVSPDVYGDMAQTFNAIKPRRLSVQTLRYDTGAVLTPAGSAQPIDVTGRTKVVVTPAAAASIATATFTETIGGGADYDRNGPLIIEAGNGNLTINHTASGARTFFLRSQQNTTLLAGQSIAFEYSVTSGQWVENGRADNIANDAVTNAKLANVATATIKGRATAGTGDPEDLSAAQVKTLLALVSADISDFTEASQDVVGALVAAAGGSYNDAAGTITLPGAAGGTLVNNGSTTVNFGAFPGTSDASVTIAGQAGIGAGSKVKAYIIATATADHSADEHWAETLDVMAGNIVPGTGFTIYAKNTGTLSEPVTQSWAGARLAGPGTGSNQARPDSGGGQGTRLYGQYTVAWEWI